MLERLTANFPDTCGKFPELLQLRRKLASVRNDEKARQSCEDSLQALPARDGIAATIRRHLHRSYPLAMRLKYVWKRKHRIPRKLLALVKT